MDFKKLTRLGLWSLVLVAPANLAVAQDAASTFSARVQPLLKTYCTECHAGAKPKAGIQLSGARTTDQLATERDHWFRVLDALDEQAPEKVERPPSALGRSLRFGTWVGALSVLRSHDRIDDDAGAATLAAAGGVGDRFERLWGRLTWPEDEQA